jgi:hypothetical protein
MPWIEIAYKWWLQPFLSKDMVNHAQTLMLFFVGGWNLDVFIWLNSNSQYCFFFKKKTNTELSCSIVRNDYIWLSPHLDTSRSMSRSKHVRDDSLRLPSFNLFSSEVKMATASLTKICADDAGVLAQIRKLDPWKKKAVYRLFECIWIFTLLSVGSTFSIKIEDVSFDMDPERVRE